MHLFSRQAWKVPETWARRSLLPLQVQAPCRRPALLLRPSREPHLRFLQSLLHLALRLLLRRLYLLHCGALLLLARLLGLC